MGAQIVLVLVGGLVTLMGVVEGAFLNEMFQRRRDAITHTRQLADNKRVHLIERYIAILLVAQQLWDRAHIYANTLVPHDDLRTGALSDALIAAYTPLMLETDQGEVIARCDAVLKEYQTLLAITPTPSDIDTPAHLDTGPFDQVYIRLTDMLATRKAELDKIP